MLSTATHHTLRTGAVAAAGGAGLEAGAVSGGAKFSCGGGGREGKGVYSAPVRFPFLIAGVPKALSIDAGPTEAPVASACLSSTSTALPIFDPVMDSGIASAPAAAADMKWETRCPGSSSRNTTPNTPQSPTTATGTTNPTQHQQQLPPPPHDVAACIGVGAMAQGLPSLAAAELELLQRVFDDEESEEEGR